MTAIGFTGTRRGMTHQQRKAVRSILDRYESGQFCHHGDCVGADAEFHSIAQHAGHFVIIHPPESNQYRAWSKFDYVIAPENPRDSILPVAPYMVRNRAIVDASDLMIATPWESEERNSGGTWATVRMARAVRKPIAIVWPSGRIEE